MKTLTVIWVVSAYVGIVALVFAGTVLAFTQNIIGGVVCFWFGLAPLLALPYWIYLEGKEQ